MYSSLAAQKRPHQYSARVTLVEAEELNSDLADQQHHFGSALLQLEMGVVAGQAGCAAEDRYLVSPAHPDPEAAEEQTARELQAEHPDLQVVAAGWVLLPDAGRPVHSAGRARTAAAAVPLRVQHLAQAQRDHLEALQLVPCTSERSS